MLSFFKNRRHLLSAADSQMIVDAIRAAEQKTSGEVRVFIESRCRYMDALDRAAEVFFNLEMDETKERNAVLVYVALKDHQLALFADEGIHQKAGEAYWKNEVALMLNKMSKEDIGCGIADCVSDIGQALHRFFPYQRDTDKNELPDEIVFGK